MELLLIVSVSFASYVSITCACEHARRGLWAMVVCCLSRRLSRDYWRVLVLWLGRDKQRLTRVSSVCVIVPVTSSGGPVLRGDLSSLSAIAYVVVVDNQIVAKDR